MLRTCIVNFAVLQESQENNFMLLQTPFPSKPNKLLFDQRRIRWYPESLITPCISAWGTTGTTLGSKSAPAVFRLCFAEGLWQGHCCWWLRLWCDLTAVSVGFPMIKMTATTSHLKPSFCQKYQATTCKPPARRGLNGRKGRSVPWVRHWYAASQRVHWPEMSGFGIPFWIRIFRLWLLDFAPLPTTACKYTISKCRKTTAFLSGGATSDFHCHSKELLSLTSINCKTSLVLLCRLAGLPPKTSLDSSTNLSIVLETARGKTIQKCICGFLAGEMQPLVKLVTAWMVEHFSIRWNGFPTQTCPKNTNTRIMHMQNGGFAFWMFLGCVDLSDQSGDPSCMVCVDHGRHGGPFFLEQPPEQQPWPEQCSSEPSDEDGIGTRTHQSSSTGCLLIWLG